jgi:hypothetical protein
MSYPSNEKVLRNTAHFFATKGSREPSVTVKRYVESMYLMKEKNNG